MKGFLIALLLSAPMFANAYTWTDSKDFGDVTVAQGQTISWTHNITDVTSGSFKAGTDTISNFSLTLWLNDDSFLDGAEKAQLKIDGSNAGTEFAVPGYFDFFGTFEYASQSANWLASLNNDGILSFSLTSTLGDFKIYDSYLEANGTRGKTSSVPEPASLALLGAGMIGIVIMRRRTARNS